jgi:hypothetical protein
LNSEVHYCIQNSQPPVPVLSQVNPIYGPQPTSLKSILITSFHIHLGVISTLFFPQVSSPKPCTNLSCAPYVPRDQPISVWLSILVVTFSQRQNCMKSSRVYSRVNCLKTSDVSETHSVSILRKSDHFPWGWRGSVSLKRRKFLNNWLGYQPEKD